MLTHKEGSGPKFQDYTVLTKVVLQKTDLDGGNNKFYALELHALSGCSYSHRVYTHYGRTERPEKGARESRFCATLQDAEREYAAILREKTGPKKGYSEVALASANIGSTKTLGAAPTTIKVAARVSTPTHDLVARLYKAAKLELAATVEVQYTAKGLETPLGVLTMDQIQRGDDALDALEAALSRGSGNFAALTSTYFSRVPHKLKRSASGRAAAVIDSWEKLLTERELLVTMRDMLQIERRGGAGTVADDSGDLAVRALRCSIEPCDIPKTRWVKTPTTPKRAWRIRREGEHEAFDAGPGNVQLLYHGSRAGNWVGILSRGIMMPRTVVAMGVKRTDAGWLGAGIYFGDALCTSAYYAHPDAAGTRYIALAEVSLGRMRDYTQITYGLNGPPPGYDSCHGVRRTPGRPSQFDDDELVVYAPNRQRLAYLLEV